MNFYYVLNEIFIIFIMLISLCLYTILQKQYSKQKDYLYFLVLIIFLFLYLFFIYY
jgi:hypothetical protein